MPRPALDWLITDTHWFHEEIVELAGRPKDFGERILASLRFHIAPQDRLFHLGDVIFYKQPLLKGMLDSVPGTKILLMGNHDRKSHRWYSRNGFAFVADMIVVDDVLLSHKPVEKLPSGVRLNIHGHWHNDEHHERPIWWSPDTHRILSIERTEYKPVRLIDFSKV